MFFVFLAFSLSKDLYLSVENHEVEDCLSAEGCGIDKIKEVIEVSDKIHVIDKILASDYSMQFLDFVNKTTHKNITIIGAETTVISPNYQISESAAIYAVNSSIEIRNFVFSNFKIPILNGEDSKYSIIDCVFKDSDCTASALIAFIDSEITTKNITIKNNTANTQSFFIGINSSVSFDELHFSANFLESQDIRAAIHFVQSNIKCTNCEILANTMKFPIFASSISSDLAIRDTLFRSNDVACIIAVEANSNVSVTESFLAKNTGSFIAGGNQSIIVLSNLNITEQKYEDESLLVLADTNSTLTNILVNNSDIGGVVSANFGETAEDTFCENIVVTNSRLTGSIFAQNSGNVFAKNIVCSNITSGAEIVVISHQNGNSTIMRNIKLSGITSTIVLSTALASVNTTVIELDFAEFKTNAICGALFENGTINVMNSVFTENQCFPQGNSLPLAIITTSASNNTSITNSTFTNNTALTGSVFLMNTTGKVVDSLFEKNQAVQGAGIVAAGMNISVLNTKFNDNQAMNVGGAVSLTEGDAFFENCEFNGNTASEGGVFSIRKANKVTIKDCSAKRNTAENATFLNEDDGVILSMPGTKVDDDFKIAMFLSDPLKHDLSSSKFSCRLRCQPPKVEARKEKKEDNRKEEKEEKKGEVNDDEFNEDKEIEEESQQVQSVDNKAIWVLPVIVFVSAALLFKKLGPRGISMTFKRLIKGKGSHAL